MAKRKTDKPYLAKGGRRPVPLDMTKAEKRKLWKETGSVWAFSQAAGCSWKRAERELLDAGII